MTKSGEFQSSQAFNHSFPINEYINPNTGSLVVSMALVNLHGINRSIDLNVNLVHTAGSSGLLGLPDGWGLGVPFIAHGCSFTCQGKTSLIDPDWTDKYGYKSGLRYVNDHGIKFERIVPSQQVPSGIGYYGYRFTYSDGACDYFDETGKLIEHNDAFKNSVLCYYTDPAGDIFGNRLDYVVDSFGQTIRFGYAPNQFIVSLPSNATTTIEFSPKGIYYISDDQGNKTIFDYTEVTGQTVVSSIEYPTGLQTRISYDALSALKEDGSSFAIPAVTRLTHLDASQAILDDTEYIYGSETDRNTYTGARAGYKMTGAGDSVMDSKNETYRYDVFVRKYDSKGKVLSAQRSYYNYLHLPIDEVSYLVDNNGKIQNGNKVSYLYPSAGTEGAEMVNYVKPIEITNYVFSTAKNDYISVKQTKNTYNQFGHLLTNAEFVFDPSRQTFIPMNTNTYQYVKTSEWAEMPENSVFSDEVTGYQRKVTFALTEDKRNIGSAVVWHSSGRGKDWKPWKKKSFSYDTKGRQVRWELTWVEGCSGQVGKVESTHREESYAYDPKTHLLMMTATDAEGGKTVSSYNVSLPGSPLVKRVTPAKNVFTRKYDSLGQKIEETGPEGNSSTISYNIHAKNGRNSIIKIGPTGYTVEICYDALCRAIKMADNGDPTCKETDITRVLSEACYDELGRLVSRTNEIGQATTYTYDALGRPTCIVDPLGNETTTVYDDAGLNSRIYINGDLRKNIQQDGMGRVVHESVYPDSTDTGLSRFGTTKYSYDGFGLKIKEVSCHAPITNPDAAVISTEVTDSVDVEGKIIASQYVGYSGAKITVNQTTTYDLLGNAIARNKKTEYEDGRTFTHSGNTFEFNSSGKLVVVRTPLGQKETSKYDMDGRLSEKKRFDGTSFCYEYDGIGNVKKISSEGRSIEYTYFRNNQVKTITSGDQTIEYSYYPNGAAKSVTFPDGKRQLYEIDRFDRIISQTDAFGVTTKTTFDELGRVATKTHLSDTLTYRYGTINHTKGVPTGVDLTGTTTIKRDFQLDGFNNLRSISAVDQSGNRILDVLYGRDDTQRLNTMTLKSDVCQDPAVNLHREFTYDGLGQLGAVSTKYTKGGKTETSSYLFDGNKNVVEKNVNGHKTSFTFNEIDQLVQDGVTYDVNGRMTADGSGRTYSYNQFDQLVEVSKEEGLKLISNRYYPNGALAEIQGATSTCKHYYNSGAVNAISKTKTGKKQTSLSFLSSDGERFAVFESGQPPEYFLKANHSTSLTIQNGKYTSLDYDAYGGKQSDFASDIGGGFTWNQEYCDPDSGLVYLRSRWYSPGMMRFMSLDNLLNDNRYSYCEGDPVGNVDPTGESSAEWATIGIIAAVAVASVVTAGVGAAVAGGLIMKFSLSTTAASLISSSFSSAAGSVAGDLTYSLVSGQSVDGGAMVANAMIGAVSAGAGTAAGNVAGTAAMSLAKTNQMSWQAITNIGLITSGAAGGLSGAAACSAMNAIYYNQPFFSTDSLINVVSGAIGGAGGGVLGSKSFLGMKEEILPAPLTRQDFNSISWAAPDQNVRLSRKLLVMAPDNVAQETAKDIIKNHGDYNAVFNVNTGNGAIQSYDTIAAHGMNGTIFARIEYQGNSYLSPISGKLFAQYLVERNPLGINQSSDPVKLISCFGASGNAQTIANQLRRPVFAGYGLIDPVNHDTSSWRRFDPQ